MVRGIEVVVRGSLGNPGKVSAQGTSSRFYV